MYNCAYIKLELNFLKMKGVFVPHNFNTFFPHLCICLFSLFVDLFLRLISLLNDVDNFEKRYL